jgi:hypothetical protein
MSARVVRLHLGDISFVHLNAAAMGVSILENGVNYFNEFIITTKRLNCETAPIDRPDLGIVRKASMK